MVRPSSQDFSRRGQGSLHQALKSNNLSKIKEILRSYSSAEIGAASKIAALIRKSYQLDSKLTTLEAAIYVGNYNICKCLIEEGASFLPTNKYRDVLRHTLERGHSKVAQLLINAGASVWTEFEHKLPLFFALSSKNCVEDTVRAIVDAGFPPNEIIHKLHNQTALHIAVKMNHISIVDYLLSELKVDPNIKDISGLTPLHYATQNNLPTIIEMLVTYGAQIDVECNENFTPLFHAISSGKEALVKLLISLGSDINHKSGQTLSLTPLHYATITCQLKIVKLLLEKGADVNQKVNESGESVVHLAARIQTSDVQKKISLDCITELFIKEKANLSLRDKFGWTPLQIAIKTNNINFAKALIINNAQLNDGLEDNPGSKIPFHTVAAYCNKELVDLCFKYGADCHKRNDEGWYPAQTAVISAIKESEVSKGVFLSKEMETEWKRTNTEKPNKDYSGVFKSFMRHGSPWEFLVRIKLTSRTRPEYPKEVKELLASHTMLSRAVLNNELPLVKIAVRQGADVRFRGVDLPFPLHFIASKGNAHLLKVFLARGVNVNALNAEGKTALHLAAESGSYKCCLLLLEHGAIYNATSPKCRQTPLEMALEKKHGEIVFLFNFIRREFQNMKKRKFKNILPRQNDLLLPILNCCNRKGKTLLGVAIEKKVFDAADQVIKMRICLTIIK